MNPKPIVVGRTIVIVVGSNDNICCCCPLVDKSTMYFLPGATTAAVVSRFFWLIPVFPFPHPPPSNYGTICISHACVKLRCVACYGGGIVVVGISGAGFEWFDLSYGGTVERSRRNTR